MIFTTYTLQEFKPIKKNSSCNYYQTPAGIIKVQNCEFGIYIISFDTNTEQSITDLKNLENSKFVLVGTEFQIKVWQAVAQIPAGHTKTYHEIAQEIGRPTAWRAVANAVGKNNLAYFIPCHRVIRKNGELGGYRWGVDKKLALLKAENINLLRSY